MLVGIGQGGSGDIGEVASTDPVQACMDIPPEEDSTDLAAYCQLYGVDAEEATARQALMPLVDVAVEFVRDLAGERLVDVRSEHRDFYGIAVVLTAGEPVAALEQYLDGLEFEHRIEYLAVLSEEEGSAVLHQWAAAGIADIDGADGGYYDGLTGAIIVDYSGVGDPRVVFGEFIEMAASLGAGFDVRIHEHAAGDARVGGLTAYTSPAGPCTEGFSIVASDGTYRTTTAGHCGNSPWSYLAANGSHTSAVNCTGERRTDSADVQWGTTAMAPLPEFHATTMTSRRTVHAVVTRAGAAGDPVCQRGAVTEYSCGEVVTISYMPWWSGACPGTTCDDTWIQVMGPDLACFQGDSGGPFFYSTSAYGFLKGAVAGGTNPGQCDYAVFMSQSFLHEINANVHIYTA